MKNQPIQPFKGFSADASNFLIELSYNNNTAFFHANKQRFTELLFEPMRSFVTEMESYLKLIDEDIETLPELGKCMVRMNRSTRFSNDKSPYKTAYWCKFIPRLLPKTGPGFFLEVGRENIVYGMGYYYTELPLLRAYRDFISNNPSRFEEIVKPFYNCSDLKLTDASYARPKVTLDSAVCMDFVNRKSISAMASFPVGGISHTKELADKVGTDFLKMKEFYLLLMQLHLSALSDEIR